ncbi:radical SAM/SPASM domain-containing protein [candidate division CSSED10-310 bacterium]|uniref:Radical SAM/SPASM domain-containing protein n=1 Tax=candidate division CSSED10-310 bacterium TaxID=2855610 RepID=A0ABV6YXJ9_UNCC1
MKTKANSFLLRVEGRLNQYRGNVTQAAKKLMLLFGLVPPPFRIQIDITDQCNFSCPTCSKWRETPSQKGLELHEWLAVFNKIGAVPLLREISISGGEPFVHSELLEILRYAKRQDLRIVLISNGWYVTRDVLQQLQTIGVDCLIVSLNSLQASVHDKSRNKPGSHERIMQLVQDWRSLSRTMRLCLEMVVTEANYKELCDLARFVQEQELNGILFQVLAPVEAHYTFSKNRQMPDTLNDWYVSDPSWIKDSELLHNEIIKLVNMQKHGVPILNPPGQLRQFPLYYKEPDLIRKIPCLGTLSRMYIDPFGDIRLCYGYPLIGNILQDDPKTVWKNEQARRIRLDSSECSRLCRMLNNNL